MPRLLAAVTPAELRQAVRLVRRLGSTAVLERREPELTELLLTEATALHERLLRHHLPDPVVRRLVRRVETLGVTLVLACSLAAHRAAVPRRPVPPGPVLWFLSPLSLFRRFV